MRPGKTIHYFLSVFAGIVSYVLGYGLLQQFVIRNLPDDSVLRLATRSILGEIGIGMEYSISLSPWQFAIPVVIGIASSFISAKIMRWFLLSR